MAETDVTYCLSFSILTSASAAGTLATQSGTQSELGPDLTGLDLTVTSVSPSILRVTIGKAGRYTVPQDSIFKDVDLQSKPQMPCCALQGLGFCSAGLQMSEVSVPCKHAQVRLHLTNGQADAPHSLMPDLQAALQAYTISSPTYCISIFSSVSSCILQVTALVVARIQALCACRGVR